MGGPRLKTTTLAEVVLLPPLNTHHFAASMTRTHAGRAPQLRDDQPVKRLVERADGPTVSGS